MKITLNLEKYYQKFLEFKKICKEYEDAKKPMKY
jgi:hypothetical protein